MESRMVLISDIQIGERARQDLGDLSDLAQSIKYFSLLAPPVVTGDLRLIAGHRRIEACKSLGTMAIPVLVAEHVVDAADLLRAERDENTCRKAMVASELIALGRQIEALQRPQSRERQVEAGRAHGRGIASVPANESYSPTTVDSRDAAAEAVGMSSSTYSRVKQVANGADGFQIRRGRRAPVSPERQAESQAALALIDRVSRGEEIRPSFDERPLTVTAIYEQWKANDDVQPEPRKAPEPRAAVRDEAPQLSPAINKRGRRIPPRSAYRSVSEGLAALDGLCAGFSRVTGFDEPLSAEEAERWLLGLTENMRVLRALHKQIKEHVHGSH